MVSFPLITIFLSPLWSRRKLTSSVFLVYPCFTLYLVRSSSTPNSLLLVMESTRLGVAISNSFLILSRYSLLYLTNTTSFSTFADACVPCQLFHDVGLHLPCTSTWQHGKQLCYWVHSGKHVHSYCLSVLLGRSTTSRPGQYRAVNTGQSERPRVWQAIRIILTLLNSQDEFRR